jgi:hypothetical protein
MPRYANHLLLYQKNYLKIAISFDLREVLYIIIFGDIKNRIEGVQDDRITGSENGKAKERVCRLSD